MAAFPSVSAVASFLPMPQVSIDQTIDAWVSPLTALVEHLILYPLPIGEAQVPLVVLWLVAAAVLFTLSFRFINLRGLAQGFRLVRGDFDDPSHAGEVTHFQALATALSGTVGLGNIAGVAIAVSVGGPGAIPWMMLAGFLGMSTKFVECTLGVKYRIEHADGSVSGGPMWYLSRGLARRGPRLALLGKVCAALFALFCIGGSFGGANMLQANQSLGQLIEITGGESSFWVGRGWLFGLLLAGLVALVILGGLRSIARVTSRIVPLMAIVYVGSALLIIGFHLEQVPAAFGLMFGSALGIDSVAGGALGVLAVGFQRAAFSSEAGVGSAAIAHSAVKTDTPVTEGLVALYEPLVDTVIVCTLTGLVIVLSGVWISADGIGGVELTSRAFASMFDGFPVVLAIAVMLFAFSTMIAWSYYGLKSWAYLFGDSRAAEWSYKLMFLMFIVFGASLQLDAIIGFSDAMILAMAFPNLLGMLFLLPEVRADLNRYLCELRSGIASASST